jgi:hypothetical protein
MAASCLPEKTRGYWKGVAAADEAVGGGWVWAAPTAAPEASVWMNPRRPVRYSMLIAILPDSP